MKSPLHPTKLRRSQGGFTLVEMLVSIVILAIIMLLASQMIQSTESVWKTTNAKIDSFQGARAGFELMTDELRQATVNTYYDYYDKNGNTQESLNASGYNVNSSTSNNNFEAVTYGRQSELHFISGPVTGGVATAVNSGISVGPNLSALGIAGGAGGAVPSGGGVFSQAVFFQTPENYTDVSSNGALQSLINATGFFVEFGPDVNPAGLGAWVINGPPTTLFPAYKPVYRFRLMQFIQPSENLTVYNYSTTPGTSSSAWFTNAVTTTASHPANVRIVSDNVIALIVWPMITDSPTDTLSNNFVYDSRLGEPSGTAYWVPGFNGLTAQPLDMNQMPPIVRVTMVTIDEPSAKALQGSSTTAPTQITSIFALKNPATGVVVFTNPQNLDSDLAFMQTQLADITPHINFRIFDTTLAERSAKFSTLTQ